jgi:thymidylate synthase (FAD)
MLADMTDTSYFFDVLDHGHVELIDSMGSDIDVVNAAKVSFAAQVTEMDEACIGLINYLMKNKHATPFEHVIFKFRIKAPIFVTREWMRHRWSSFNEMSMRYYKPEKIDYYVPAFENIRKQVGKPGAYKFENIDDENIKHLFYETMLQIAYVADNSYHDLVNAGIAKELARCVLPVCQYTEFIWTVNARSLINFISLRNEENAQYEIQEYAKAVEECFANKMPITYESFCKNGRQAI